MAKRERDYAAERSRRDAKYQAMGYRNYNDYDTQRRKAKAVSHGYRSAYMENKTRKTVRALMDKLDLGALGDGTNYWELFRIRYNATQEAA